jgi:DNA-binding NarL/FixJ family response regulator
MAILGAALDGKQRHEIARARGRAETTVKRQVSTLLRKTGDRSLLAAVARLLREG